jgi:hypothetical protein
VESSLIAVVRSTRSERTMKKPAAPSNRKPRSGVSRKRRTLAELNQWLAVDHDVLMDEARKNCLRLTGRPTFGGIKRRKSA